ncbi:TraR/DksA family transcriptional regulator [Primorskyibacter flagellatus]|uniref:Transcriptional regulator, TraR/DksA family n=1 Tax=Primorskyibacter flagellatus TaxID=1387277 RepID=A0A1W1Z321_9RHOB|nr:TraR/DksA C4-type zinc finger protein [Primorskyibacter flagellatus]SMC42786.1 transcriptional regulator, TraR/DksA family [Primorskyibacter flagellatus]
MGRNDKFRELLKDRLAALTTDDALAQDAQAVVELDQQAVGRLSRMDALQMQAMARAGQVRRDAEAQRLRQALLRLDQDEYGWCDDCGEKIAEKRLEVDLTATRCIGCASG